jgi:excisionase family DNA binding protein
MALLTPKIVAEQLDVNEQTIRLWIRTGKLKGKKLGGEWRIDTEDLDEFVSGQINNENNQDLNLIKLCDHTLDILGINALGPLYLGRPLIKEKLAKGVKVRILLMDPDCDALYTKAFEEEVDFGGIPSGRLKAELEASYAICRDLMNFVDHYNCGNENSVIGMEVHKISTLPKASFIIIDYKTAQGKCQVKIHPEDPTQSCIHGTKKILVKSSDPDDFEMCIEEFQKLWDEGAAHVFEFKYDENKLKNEREKYRLKKFKLQFKHATFKEDNNVLKIEEYAVNKLKKDWPLEYSLLEGYIDLGKVIVIKSV